jgi:hypothetical protein
MSKSRLSFSFMSRFRFPRSFSSFRASQAYSGGLILGLSAAIAANGTRVQDAPDGDLKNFALDPPKPGKKMLGLNLHFFSSLAQ